MKRISVDSTTMQPITVVAFRSPEYHDAAASTDSSRLKGST